MAKIKVRRTLREELPGMVVLRDAAAADLPAFPRGSGVLDLEMEADQTLQHLVTHDPDGCLTALDRDETLGFAAAHVRSRQWVLSEMWVLPQHRGLGAGAALIDKALAYGERSGARDFLAMVPVEGAIQSLLVSHGFRHITPVFALEVPASDAETVGAALSRLHPGQEVTSELFNRRGQADLDRIDKLTRGITRAIDHVHWLKERRMGAAFVRQGDRIAAYAYGGRDQVGPVAGSTQDAALCAIGWALTLAVKQRATGSLRILVPEHFRTAVEALLDNGARIAATFALYGRDVSQSFDRCAFGALSLP